MLAWVARQSLTGDLSDSIKDQTLIGAASRTCSAALVEPHRIRDLQGSWSRIRAAIGLHSTLIPIALSHAGQSETLCCFTESALKYRLVHHVETCRSLRAGRSFECRRQAFSLR